MLQTLVIQNQNLKYTLRLSIDRVLAKLTYILSHVLALGIG